LHTKVDGLLDTGFLMLVSGVGYWILVDSNG